MASRIRTIKPDFFRHEGLFEAEQRSGLPLRIAFAGLWTVADREGRFRWRPRQLKLDVLPFDEVSFNDVLDALKGAGFIVHYAAGGEEYGAIPSWAKHQVINNREHASVLPAAPGVGGSRHSEAADAATRDSHVCDASATREARARDASTTPLMHAPVEGKGKGKGKEGEGEGDSPGVAPPAAPKPAKSPKPPAEPKASAPTAAVWASYSAAYLKRYGVEPVRNAMVNGQLANFVSRIPADEAADVAAFFVARDNGLYLSASHPVNLLVRDAESLRMQWATGRTTAVTLRPDGAAQAAAQNDAARAQGERLRQRLLDAQAATGGILRPASDPNTVDMPS